MASIMSVHISHFMHVVPRQLLLGISPFCILFVYTGPCTGTLAVHLMWRLRIIVDTMYLYNVMYVLFLLQTLVIPASMRTTVNVGTLTIRAKPPQDKEVSCHRIQYESFNHYCYLSPL